MFVMPMVSQFDSYHSMKLTTFEMKDFPRSPNSLFALKVNQQR